MARKVRQLITELETAGFVHTSTHGSHRKFRHPAGITMILSGRSGADAYHYQEKETRRAIAASQDYKT
jgi:predicted RNA binding protein YcfA (HicA-like mRNA interferase family)